MSTEQSLRVLIVDDNRDGADALGLLLEELGHQVHVTYTGTQALDVATAFRADLMLVDLVMPEMDGCRLATNLRRNPSFTHTKLVAMTGQDDVKNKALAHKAGFDAFLVKPVPLIAIKAVLDGVVVANASQAKEARHPDIPVRTERPERRRDRLPIEEARRIKERTANRKR